MCEPELVTRVGFETMTYGLKVKIFTSSAFGFVSLGMSL
jgi:hypothetical protein